VAGARGVRCTRARQPHGRLLHAPGRHRSGPTCCEAPTRTRW
jgi:hypothetical protein